MSRKSVPSVKIRKGRKHTFFIVALIIALLTVISYTGISVPEPGGTKIRLAGASEIRFGIDIRGGVEAVYAPKNFKGKPTEDQLQAINKIMETRLDNLNILDRDIIIDRQNGYVIVRFPWKSKEAVFDPAKAMKELGETAHLTFKDESGKVVLEGSDVKKASHEVNTQNGENVVSLELTPEGAKKFAVATKENLGKNLSINMDEKMLSNPRVNSVISEGRAMISPMESPKAAVDLAGKINAGSLPFDIEAISSSSISPSLGNNALSVMLRAGIVAFIILSIFLLLYYRLPGFVAIIALLAQIVGIMLGISIPQQTLTLQGIAGIILSIVMGINHNIIISERIKEELRGGATLLTAIASGFDRAFSSILDGNVTVAISAVCLMVFGTGSMLSFGYSLLLGVILNLICGATASHLMVSSLAAFKQLRNTWLYGDYSAKQKARKEGGAL